MQYTALPTWSLAVSLEASADLMLPRWQLTSVRRVNSKGWHEILSDLWKLTQIQPSDKSLENFQSKDFFTQFPVSDGDQYLEEKYQKRVSMWYSFLAFIQALAQTLRLESSPDALLISEKQLHVLCGHKLSQKSIKWKIWRKEYFHFFLTKLEGLKGA